MNLKKNMVIQKNILKKTIYPKHLIINYINNTFPNNCFTYMVVG